MAKGRSISLDMPKYLLDQIQQRASISGRSRNAELRYLVDLGLRYAGEAEVLVEIPDRLATPWVQSIGRLSLDVYQLVAGRADEFHRGVGSEIIRLVAYAMEETARRDLAVITEMMSRMGRSAQLAPQTAVS